MKIHNLKSWKWVYDDVVHKQDKTFEIRKDDRDFQKNDIVVFWEVTQDGLETGIKSKPFLIDYVLKHDKFPQGLMPGYCAFSVIPHQVFSVEYDNA